MKEFQTEIHMACGKQNMLELKYLVKSSSGNGSRVVAVLQNHMSHTASTENDTSHMVPNPHCIPVLSCS